LRGGKGTRATATEHLRSAFYALGPGGWRDYITLLHPPYTLWHLSYVVLGAALAPAIHYDRLAATLVAFLLGLGFAAHALDELSGRPLKTQIPSQVLWLITVAGLGGAVGLGVAGSIVVTPWLLAFVAFGLFIAPAYNLEWFGGIFHTDYWFALAWGSFPLLTAYWVNGQRLELSAFAGAAAAFGLSLAQRTLSHRVRTIRRRVREVEGTVFYLDGRSERIDRVWALGVEERALLLLSGTAIAVSVAAVLTRV
jgi:hypothetical protein